MYVFFFFSSRRRHTRLQGDWSSDVCSSDLPETVQLATAALGAGAAVGILLPYSRLQESEADHLGLIYMAKAGYHPSAARDLWVRMAGMSKAQQKPPEFLSRHPGDSTRIMQRQARWPDA